MVASVDYATQEALTDIQSIPVDSVETEDLQVLGTIISMMSEVSEYDSLFSSDAISLSIDILTAINERQDAIAAISAQSDDVFIDEYVKLLGNLLDIALNSLEAFSRRRILQTNDDDDSEQLTNEQID